MDNQQPQTPEIPPRESPVKVQELRGREFALEIVRGIGALSGMAILWALEIVRDRYFSLLERWNIRPRRKRASAFPPGRPKQKTAA